MRYVIYGAGAIGGVMGAWLLQSDREVALIARGAHLQALQTEGLTFISPECDINLPVAAFGSPAEAGLTAGDVIVLAMKSQDTPPALEALAELPGAAGLPIVCAQNGVENERLVLREFDQVYGMMVILPGSHLQPGVVEVSIAPRSGTLVVGCYPAGTDALTATITADFAAAGFAIRESAEVMRWKYAKLLSNLGNILDAAFKDQDTATLRDLLVAEAHACYTAAGIEPASAEEMHEVRSAFFGQQQSGTRAGSSTWQRVARGLPTLETAYLNGEVVLLGRLHGVPTPANTRMVEVSHELTRAGAAAHFDVAEVLAQLASAG